MNEVLKLTIKKFLHDKRVIVSLMMLLVVGATLAVTSYTWFFKGGTLLTIEFQTGYVEMNIGLYEGQDFDHDGVLDTDPAANVYTPLYTPLPTVAGRANPITVSGIQSDEEVLKLPDITMENLAPGQVYTYKFAVRSLGDIDSLFDIQLTEYGDDAQPADIKDHVSVDVLLDGEIISHNNLAGWDDSSGPLALTQGITTGAVTTDVILQFKFNETGDLLSSNYEGGSFSLPDMRLRIYSVE